MKVNYLDSIIIALYKSVMRPHLKYYIEVWSSHLMKNIIESEKMEEEEEASE